MNLAPRYEPSAETAESEEPVEKTEVVERWDPVTRVEYLTALEETPPGDDLVLETRRQALDSAGPSA